MGTLERELMCLQFIDSRWLIVPLAILKVLESRFLQEVDSSFAHLEVDTTTKSRDGRQQFCSSPCGRDAERAAKRAESRQRVGTNSDTVALRAVSDACRSLLYAIDF